jgi:DHA2 family multidrug resistance protein
MATFMQAINISLANIAFMHMQGTLSMSTDEVGWVFSSYIGASLVIMLLTRWLAGRYGRKASIRRRSPSSRSGSCSTRAPRP